MSPLFTCWLQKPRGSERSGRRLRPALQSRKQEGRCPHSLSHALGPGRPLVSCLTEHLYFMIVPLTRRQLEKTLAISRESAVIY